MYSLSLTEHSASIGDGRTEGNKMEAYVSLIQINGMVSNDFVARVPAGRCSNTVS